MVKTKAYWTRADGTRVTFTHEMLLGSTTEDEKMSVAYAVRDGLRLHGYEAEVIIGTEAAVE